MAHHPYLVGLVGTGVGPSLTPALHMAEASAHGLDYVYRTIDLNAAGVAPEQIGEVLDWARALGFNALNVTHPCKRLVIEHLDEVDDAAAATRRGQHRRLRRIAAQSDTTPTHRASRIGFGEGLPGAATDNVVLIGAGGAGAAVGRRPAAPRRRPPHGRRRRRRTRHRARPRAGRRGTQRPGSTRRRRTSCRCCCPPATASCTARRPEWPTTPACRSTPSCCTAGCGSPTSSTGRWTPHCCGAALAAGCRTLDGGHMAVHQATERLRPDHRHHPRRRPHVPTLPPSRRLNSATDNHFREETRRNHERRRQPPDPMAQAVIRRGEPRGGPHWPASWAAPSSTTTSSSSAPPPR